MTTVDGQPPAPAATAGVGEHPAVSHDDSRQLRDAAGRVWWVREMDASRVPGARAPRCLVFDSDVAVRRVWRYPADWRALTDATLRALAANGR